MFPWTTNIGADNAPVFSRIKRDLFQDDMIELGQGASPTFFDFDSDGLIDLLVSNYTMITDSCPTTTTSYDVYAYKNIGTATEPKFNLISTDYNNISTKLPNLPAKHLTFGDVDNDGDSDLFVGDYLGKIFYLNNNASTGAAANFVYVDMVRDDAAPGNAFIDVGSYATPQLIDVDRDSDLDIIIGELSGNLNYYENIGTVSSPTFELTSNVFGGVDVLKFNISGYSVPFMFDSSGKYNLMVSSEANKNFPASGWIWYYKDIDANLNGNFTLVDSTYKSIWEGHRMTIHGADINSDGSIDLAIGNYAGGVAIYMGDSNAVPVPEINPASFDFMIYPNPSSGYSSISISRFLSDEKYYLHIYNSIGEAVYSQSLTHSQTKIDKLLSSGVYSYQVSTKKFRKTKKLVVLK